MPKVSVVMPAYNAEKYIGEAIDSILNQTFTDFEFIIIDDGSSDRTADIVKSYTDPRIRLLVNERNSGIVVSLNRGLQNATGKYIARMDSDDFSRSDRIKKQVDFLDNHPEVIALGTSFSTFGEGIKSRQVKCEADARKAKVELIFSPCMAHPTAMIRKNILDNYGIKYNEAYVGTEDYALWWELAKYGDIKYLIEDLFKYRIHKSQVSRVRNEASVKRFKKLIEERMSFFDIVLSEEEQDAFLDYTSGYAEKFSIDKVNTFMSILKRIKQWNRKSRYYDKFELDVKFEIVMMECLRSQRLTTKDKIQGFMHAYKDKLVSIRSGVKLVYWGVKEIR